jgi:hypothetical protein
MKKSNRICLPVFSLLFFSLVIDQNLWAQSKTMLNDTVYQSREGFQKVRINQKYGFKSDKSLQLVVPAIYGAATDFSEGLAAVKLDGKVGFVNSQGKVAIPLQFTGANSFRNGIAIVSFDKQMYFIDKWGNQASVRKYEAISAFDKIKSNYYLAKKDGKFGLLNPTGLEIIPPEYDYLGTADLKIFAAKRGDKYGYIDSVNNVVLPFDFTDANIFTGDNNAIVKKNGKYGVIDRKGREVIPFYYKSLDDDQMTGLYHAENASGFHGLLDEKGKVIVDFSYDDIEDFGLFETGEKEDDIIVGARVKKGSMVGLIGLSKNLKAKEVITLTDEFTRIYQPVKGMAVVSKNSRFAVYSIKNQEILISFRYDGIGDNSENKYIVRKGDKYGFARYVDRKKFETSDHEKFGEIKYEKVRLFKNGFAAVKLNNKWGFLDETGTESIFPRYDSVEDFSDGKARVVQGTDTFFIDVKGRAVR